MIRYTYPLLWAVEQGSKEIILAIKNRKNQEAWLNLRIDILYYAICRANWN